MSDIDCVTILKNNQLKFKNKVLSDRKKSVYYKRNIKLIVDNVDTMETLIESWKEVEEKDLDNWGEFIPEDVMVTLHYKGLEFEVFPMDLKDCYKITKLFDILDKQNE